MRVAEHAAEGLLALPPEQHVKTEQNATVSSPASFASQEERQYGLPCSPEGQGQPTYSEPTDGLFGSGLSMRAQSRHRKRKRRETPVLFTQSTGGASAGGACDHCGRRNSPAWRRGPPNKPHLCNACGVRFLGKGTLDGYMPGMKHHKDEHMKLESELVGEEDDVCDDTDSAKTTMPQLSGKAASRRQRTPRRTATPRSDVVSGPPAADAESDDDEAGSLASWADYVDKAKNTEPEQWRKVASLIQAAVRMAKADSSTSQYVVDELERALGLFWQDKEAAMRLLSNLSDVEMLLTLSGGSLTDGGGGRQPRPTPPPGSKAHAQQYWAVCGSCGKTRATSRWMAVWEDFRCGNAESLNPDRSCLAPSDVVVGASLYPPVLSGAPKRRRLSTPVEKARRVPDDGDTSDLDILAAAAKVAVTNTRGRAAGAQVGPRKRPGTVPPPDAEVDPSFLSLPVGWRKEVVYIRVAAPEGVLVDTSYVSPDKHTRVASLADARAHLAGTLSKRRSSGGASGATFTPGPAFHRSPSGSVLVSHSGGPAGPSVELVGLVDGQAAARLVRSDLSLTHLAAAAGHLSRDASPSPSVAGAVLGLTGMKSASISGPRVVKPRSLASPNSAPHPLPAADVQDLFSFRHPLGPPSTPPTPALPSAPRGPVEADEASAPGPSLPHSVRVVVAGGYGAVPGQALPSGLVSHSRASRSPTTDWEGSVGAAGWAPGLALWKHKSEPAAVLQQVARAEAAPARGDRCGGGVAVPAARACSPQAGVALAAAKSSGMRANLKAKRGDLDPSRAAPGADKPADAGHGGTPPALGDSNVHNSKHLVAGRALNRAVSEPSSAAKAFSAAGLQKGHQDSANLASWVGVVRVVNGLNAEDLFTVLANLSQQDAAQLPPSLLISSFKPRQDIFMAVAEKPLLLQLGECSPKQREAVQKMEEEKLAAVVHLDSFDFALIPHTNQRNGLHIVGLKQRERKRDAAVGALAPAERSAPHAAMPQLQPMVTSGMLQATHSLPRAAAATGAELASRPPPALFHSRPGVGT